MIKKKPVRELLAESLAELLNTRSFEKITVNEIAENCGVGRRTFYNNFKDKYDLATWIYIHHLNDYIEDNDHATLSGYLWRSTEIVVEHLDIIIAFDKYKGQNSFKDSIEEPMENMLIQVIEKFYQYRVTPEMKEDICFFVCGQISYVAKKLSSPAIPSKQETMQVFLRCIPKSLVQFIE